jgi:ElaB/YqjD/DUF883 family membrane-anchored ribosome-binding protein
MTDKTEPKSTKPTNEAASDPAQAEGRSAEEIERDIEATRAEMGDTVEALAEKTDVKAQARKQADEVRARAQEKVNTAKTKVTETKDDLLGKAQEASPETARTAAAQVQQKARENPLPVAVGAAVLVGFVLGRLSRR